MFVTRLEPGAYYWATHKKNSGGVMVVQVSTVFGEDREYWTLTVSGSGEHHMPADFDIIAHIVEPVERGTLRQAAE